MDILQVGSLYVTANREPVLITKRRFIDDNPVYFGTVFTSGRTYVNLYTPNGDNFYTCTTSTRITGRFDYNSGATVPKLY